MPNKELFIEIYTEETPIQMQKNIGIDNKMIGVLIDIFKDFGVVLTGEDIYFAKTPVRRLISVLIPEVLIKASDEIKGPRVDAAEIAIDGFLRKYKLEKSDLDIENGYYIYRTAEIKGNTLDLLANITTECFKRWENCWPMVSEWANGFNWPRPIRGLNVSYDDKLINCKISDIQSSQECFGHKFSNVQNVKVIRNLKEAEEFLAVEKITLDQTSPEVKMSRLDSITLEIEKLQNCSVNKEQIEIIKDANTLCESVSIVLGELDIEYRKLPKELIIAVLRNHLKYIPLVEKNGDLNYKFAIVIDSNSMNPAKEASILRGNQTVLNARMKDALFFFERDKNTGIEDLKAKLAEINFDEKLGSVLDGVDRIKAMYMVLDKKFSFGVENAEEIFDHIKLDLGSGMIGEFPELQGYMSYYYFSDSVKNKELFKNVAIYQYRTIADLDGVRDCKKTLGLLLAIWLEYAVSLLYAGHNPTSSKDPFGIRRRLKYVFEIAEKDLGLANFKVELAGVLEGCFDEILRIKSVKDGEAIIFDHEWGTENIKNIFTSLINRCEETFKQNSELIGTRSGRHLNKENNIGVANSISEMFFCSLLKDRKQNVIPNSFEQYTASRDLVNILFDAMSERPEAIELAKLKLGIGIKELAEKITEVALKHQKD